MRLQFLTSISLSMNLQNGQVAGLVSSLSVFQKLSQNA